MGYKVLFAPSWYPTRDNQLKGTFFREQAEALNKFGDEIVVAYVNIRSLKSIFKAKNADKLGFNIEMENGVMVYRLNAFNFFPRLNKYMVVYYNFLFNILCKKIFRDKGNFDVIHVQSALPAGLSCVNIKNKYKIPMVVTEHSSHLGRKVFDNFQLGLFKKTINTADAVIAVSSNLKSDILNSLDEEKNIDIIPNIINFNYIGKIKAKDSKYFTEEKEFKFFSLAHINKNKGMDVLIRAFAVFKNKKVKLFIGGDGPELENLKSLSAELGLKDQVVFLGKLTRDEAFDFMNLCDAFVLASRYETFGIVYGEALACGKPIIATRCGGAEDIVNSKNGYLVEVDDITGLSKSMEMMCENLERFNGDEITEDCKFRFGEESIVKNINNVYDRVINGRSI